jgi:sulfofructose kinase
MMAAVFVVGAALVDFVFSLEEFPNGGEKYRAKDACIVGGGCAANAAVAIARLGGEANLAARLGDDFPGDLIIKQLADENVDTKLIHRAENGRSSYSSVFVDRNGERQIVNFRGDGLIEQTDWIEQAPSSDAILVDTRWSAGAKFGLEMAAERNIPGIVDAEAPLEPELLSLASHVAFSRSGIQSISSQTSLADCLAEIATKLPGWTCVTDGENGVYYTVGDHIEHMPAFQVEVKDTLAAGDIWHGAFVLLLGEGADEKTAIRFANGAAAMKSMSFGGRAGCPDRRTLNAFLKENN